MAMDRKQIRSARNFFSHLLMLFRWDLLRDWCSRSPVADISEIMLFRLDFIFWGIGAHAVLLRIWLVAGFATTPSWANDLKSPSSILPGCTRVVSLTPKKWKWADGDCIVAPPQEFP